MTKIILKDWVFRSKILVIIIGLISFSANSETLTELSVSEANSFDMNKKLNSGEAVVTITGKIVDAEGYPLPGATVTVQGTTRGTVTDGDGNYTISAVEGATLQFSFIGYATQTVVIGNSNVINITMTEDAQSLSEVVIVGYGTQKATNLTGAIDVVDGKMIESRPSPSVSQLLQGTSPGLTFSVGNNGFQPGANLGPEWWWPTLYSH